MAQPTITSVTPISFLDGQAGVVIAGTNFNTPQGIGVVELSDNSTYGAGTLVGQTVTNWTDTSITITTVQGGLSSGALSLFVSNSDPLTSAAFAVILADAAKSASDTGTGVESDLELRHLAKRFTAASDVADATRPPGGAATFRVPAAVTGGGKIIAVYQAGGQGVTGLAYRQSNDGGESWSAETQISPTTNVYPAGVMNNSTGDIHLAYARQGTPSLDATYSLWFRVLAFNGTTWTVGGETALETGSASNGYSNATAAVDANGRIFVACLKRPSAGNWIIRSVICKTAWDLSTAAHLDQITTTAASLARQVIVKGATSTTYEFILIVEQAGTFRLYTGSAATSGGVVTLTQMQTWFKTSTAEFDAAWNDLPSGQTVGQLFYVQHDGNNIIYATWTGNTNSLSPFNVLVDGTSQACSYPAVQADGKYWDVAWLQAVAANQNALRLIRTDDLTRVVHVSTDDAADGWGWVKLPKQTVDQVEMLIILSCETLNTPFDVNITKLGTDVFKTATDIGGAVATIANGPPLAETATASEGLVAGEAMAATDAGAGADTISGLKPQVFETGAGAETFPTQQLGLAEAAALADVLKILQAAAETGAAVSTNLVEDEKAAAETGAGAASPIVAPDLDDEPASGDDEPAIGHAATDAGAGDDLFARLVPVAEDAAGQEAFGAGGGSGVQFFVSDAAFAKEAFGGSGGTGRIRHDILADASLHAAMYPGLAPHSALGWDPRGFLNGGDELKNRLFCFEDVREDMEGIVFVTFPADATRWSGLYRSSDGGRTFARVNGLEHASCVAMGSDGVLWCTGSDGVQPSGQRGALFCGDGGGQFGSRLTCWQVWKSVDKGLTWSKSYSGGSGAYCRYPSYLYAAVDPADPSRILVGGLGRGSVTGKDREFVSSEDGGQTWTLLPDASSSPWPSGDLNSVGGSQWAYPNVMAALNDGRFLYAAHTGGGLCTIWITDDLGAHWTVAYTASNMDNWVDCVSDGDQAYIAAYDRFNANPSAQILKSSDNGSTWASMTLPTEPTQPGHWTALALDRDLDVLYVGVDLGGEGPYRMDDPPGGSWASIKDDLSTVTGDATPTIAVQGMKVLRTITGIVDVGLTDAISMADSQVVTVVVQDAGSGSENAAFSFNVFDAAVAAEIFEILRKSALTIRLFMRSGRAIIRVEGSTMPAVPGNPEG